MLGAIVYSSRNPAVPLANVIATALTDIPDVIATALTDIRQEKQVLGQSPTGRTPVLVGARQEGDQQ